MKLTWKYPFIVFPKVADCVVCAFKTTIESTILFSSECPHMNKGVLKPRLFTTNRRLWMYLIINWTIVFGWATKIYLWKLAEEQNEGFIQNMFSLFSQSWTSLVMVYSIQNRSIFIKYFNGISELILKSKRFGMPSLFPQREVEKVQYGSTYIVLLCCVIMLIQMVSRLYSYGVGFSNLIQTIGFCLNSMYGGGITVHMVYWLRLYEYIINRLFQLLRQEFEYRRRQNSIQTSLNNSPFADKLRLYQKYYASCILNYQNHILVFASLLFDVCHFLFVIVCQIFFCLYISFMFLHPNLEMKSGATGGLLQSCYVVGITYYFLKRSNSLYNIGNDFISYLHRYPISQLTQEESQLVEVLINYLTYYKPTLIPADIFHLHKKIIPSTIGHVITYSLVAMQFNIFRYFY